MIAALSTSNPTNTDLLTAIAVLMAVNAFANVLLALALILITNSLHAARRKEVK